MLKNYVKERQGRTSVLHPCILSLAQGVKQIVSVKGQIGSTFGPTGHTVSDVPHHAAAGKHVHEGTAPNLALEPCFADP